MKSTNLSVFLLLGYYEASTLFYHDLVLATHSRPLTLIFWFAFLPISAVIRRRFAVAASLLGTSILILATMLLIRESAISTDVLLAILGHPPLPILAFLFFLLPGFFMLTELESDRLPHELTYWIGLRLVSPLISVLAARDRIGRRLSAIRETCHLRGISLASPFQHVIRFHVWIVPLISSTICEAAYAQKHREMLHSADRFIPTRPIVPIVSPIQRAFFILLVVTVVIGIPRCWRATHYSNGTRGMPSIWNDISLSRNPSASSSTIARASPEPAHYRHRAFNFRQQPTPQQVCLDLYSSRNTNYSHSSRSYELN